MIDLHAHTTASDGTDSPAELVARACRARLEALGIADHDTLAGYDEAVPAAREAGLELVCGIEISTRHRGKAVHLLGYFLDGDPPPSFREWVTGKQAARRDRNARLAARLQRLGIKISLEEAEAVGCHMTGRPHFARLLVEKGYARNAQEAFDNYIGESGSAFVRHESPSLFEAIGQVNAADGLSSLAHPVRPGAGNHTSEERWLAAMCEAGLRGIEAHHSDHEAADVERFLGYARKFGLAVTGGSDYHGDTKRGVELATGRNGNVLVPRSLLDELRRSLAGH